MNEEWKDIPGYEGIYQINCYGYVKSVSRKKVGKNSFGKFYYYTKEKILKRFYSSTGYAQVTLHKNGSQRSVNIHRIVANIFIQNPDNLPMVNHKDGNKSNPEANNLEWCTLSQNIKHAYDVIGIVPHGLGKFGKDSNKSRPVIQKNIDGEIIKKWDSGMDAVRSGFDSSCISRCCSGESKTHKGYLWEYA